MADRTDCRLTRDLMLDAVPCSARQTGTCPQINTHSGRSYVRILQPASWQRGETWSLGAGRGGGQSALDTSAARGGRQGRRHTNDERDHARPVAAGSLEPLDQLLHLPYFDLSAKAARSARGGRRADTPRGHTDILLRLAGLCVAHFGSAPRGRLLGGRDGAARGSEEGALGRRARGSTACEKGERGERGRKERERARGEEREHGVGLYTVGFGICLPSGKEKILKPARTVPLV